METDGIMIFLGEERIFMTLNNYDKNINKGRFGLITLIFGLLPIIFLTLAIMVGFAFGQSGLILGGMLTYGLLGLMPISNFIGFIYGLVGITKSRHKSGMLISGLIINILFIIFYVVYFIDWIRHGF